MTLEQQDGTTVATVLVDDTATSHHGTTEPSKGLSLFSSPRVLWTNVRYRHSDGTWGDEPEEVLSTDSDSDNLFENNNPDTDVD